MTGLDDMVEEDDVPATSDMREIYQQSYNNMRAYIALRFRHLATFAVLMAFSITAAFQITELEAYPVFEGEAYAQHLHEAAAAVNRRDGLTQAARTVVRDGDYLAIGLVRIQVTLSSRAGREAVQQLAVMPRALGGKWEFRDEDRTLGTLWRATRVLFDDMMRNDDRVINCTRGVDVSQDRGPSLECATTVLGREFAS